MLSRVLSRSLLFAVLLVANNARVAGQTPAGTDAAEKRVEAIEMRLGGRLGVTTLDTGNSRRLEHRASERFPMCSTFKLLAVAAVLHRVDEKAEQLTRFIPYTKAELLEYAPVTTERISEGGMTLAALCAAAVEESDNTAANLLLQTIGGPEGLTGYARSLGDERTRLDRLEPYLNSAVPGDERDTTTPEAMVATLRTLLLGDALLQQLYLCRIFEPFQRVQSPNQQSPRRTRSLQGSCNGRANGARRSDLAHPPAQSHTPRPWRNACWSAPLVGIRYSKKCLLNVHAVDGQAAALAGLISCLLKAEWAGRRSEGFRGQPSNLVGSLFAGSRP